MAVTSIERNRRPSAALALFLAALMSFPVPAYSENRDSDEANQNTATPIKHVIVIIGENRTFDNIFATYVPKHGTVSNLLSRGIVHSDGSPGPNADLAQQFQLQTVNPTTYFVDTRKLINPGKTAYSMRLRPSMLQPSQLLSYTPFRPHWSLKIWRSSRLERLVCRTAQPTQRFPLLLVRNRIRASRISTSFQTPHSKSPAPSCRMTVTPAIWFIAFSICGSRRIAAYWMRRNKIPRAARMTSCPSSASLAATIVAATQWGSTTSREAMRHSSSAWLMNTRSTTIFTSRLWAALPRNTL